MCVDNGKDLLMFQNKTPLCILMSLVKILSNIVSRLKRMMTGIPPPQSLQNGNYFECKQKHGWGLLSNEAENKHDLNSFAGDM